MKSGRGGWRSDRAEEVTEASTPGRIEPGRTLVLRGEDEDLLRAREFFQSCGAAGDFARL